jgi:hypothetical protein
MLYTTTPDTPRTTALAGCCPAKRDNQTDGDRIWIHFQAPPAASRSPLVEVEGTVNILKMLPPEAAECQCMGVVDHNFWGISHLVTMLQPMVTKFAVFSGGKREGLVRAVYGTEVVYGQRQIVGTEDIQEILQTVPGRLGRHERSSWLGFVFHKNRGSTTASFDIWQASRACCRSVNTVNLEDNLPRTSFTNSIFDSLGRFIPGMKERSCESSQPKKSVGWRSNDG